MAEDTFYGMEKKSQQRDVSLLTDVKLLVVICQSWLMNQQPCPQWTGAKPSTRVQLQLSGLFQLLQLLYLFHILYLLQLLQRLRLPKLLQAAIVGL